MPPGAFDDCPLDRPRAPVPDHSAGAIAERTRHCRCRTTKADAFHAPEEWRASWSRDYTRAEWLELLPTQGGMTRLPAETRAALLADLAARIGDFTTRYTTIAVTARRR